MGIGLWREARAINEPFGVSAVDVTKEKRRYSRVADPVCAWLSFRRDPAAYATLTMDIGVEGARFSARRSVNIGEQVTLSFQLPTANIECKGRVCWCQEGNRDQHAFGVRFVDLREGERDCLGRHLTHAGLC